MKEGNDEFVFTLGDIAYAIRKRKSFVFGWMIFISLVAGLYTLTQPYQYTAEGSFRVKEHKSSGINQSLINLLGGVNIGGENDAIALLKSTRVLEEVVRKLNLQATLEEFGKRPSKMGNCKQNLQIEYAYLTNRKTPLVLEKKQPLICTKINYRGEIPLSFLLYLERDRRFTVKSVEGQKIGSGILNEPFYGEDYSFVLQAKDSEISLPRKFALTIHPCNAITKFLLQSVNIEPDKKAKNILLIKYRDHHRQRAMNVVNAIMDVYRDYLREELKDFSEIQLAYLNQRKEESLDSLEGSMLHHANMLSQDLSIGGFIDSDVEIKFLVDNQTEAIKNLNKIEIRLEFLKTILDTQELKSIQYYPSLSSSATLVLNELRDIMQKRDLLSFTLSQNQDIDEEKIQKTFLEQTNDLANILKIKKELNEAIHRLERDETIDENFAIFQDPTLLIKHWVTKMERDRYNGNRDEFLTSKYNCLSYLNQLSKQYDIYEKIISERLLNKYNPCQEYQGVDLDTANSLLVEYNKYLNQMESGEKKCTFVLEQLNDPNIEISSLSSTLEDPICKDIISKSYQLSLTLRDETNRSSKELERTRIEMDMQRQFLRSHLTQSISIFRLNQDLSRNKIRSLQEVMLELMNETVSVCEKQLKDYISSEMSSLKQEKLILENFIAQLNQKLAKIPEKWVSEQLLKQKIVLNKTSTEEIIKLVEGKNIAQNLEVVQSNKIDRGLASIHPDSPRFILFVGIGAFLGAFLGVSYVLLESIFRGVFATPENLRLSGKHVSGKIVSSKSTLKEPVSDENLSTLRRLISFLGDTKTAVLLQGNGCDFAAVVASLLHKRGERVLLLPLDCSLRPDDEFLPGLLQYLKNEVDFPKIVSFGAYDLIYTGGISRFGVESISSKRFYELLKSLKHKYDRILATTQVPVISAEAVVIAEQFEAVSVTLHDESLTDLRGILKFPKSTFIFQ